MIKGNLFFNILSINLILLLIDYQVLQKEKVGFMLKKTNFIALQADVWDMSNNYLKKVIEAIAEFLNNLNS